MRKHKKSKSEAAEEVILEESLAEPGVEAGSEEVSAPDSEGADESITEYGDDTNDLETALKEAQSELDRHREAMLRMQAEMDNQRKRLVRETEKSRKFALERFMKDLLQVHDSLERGLEIDTESATVEGLREGEALTLKMLDKVMQDHGLQLVDPLGEPFNPEFHEAVTMAPS